MKKFLKIVFGRATVVAIAIILQIIFSIFLPYLLNYWYPHIFNNVYLHIELIINTLALILIVYLINSNTTVEGKLTWVVTILVFPILGLILYTLFVRETPPFKHKKYYKACEKQIVKFQSRESVEIDELKRVLGSRFGQFEYIYSSTNLKAYKNSSVQFCPTGEKFFEELVKELEGAKKYIFMEYFIIERGEMWLKILNVLKRKVEQGVEVRVMYDDLGTINKLPSNYARRLKKLGIKCVKFNSFLPIMSAMHNNRDHRKIAIVDGKVAFIGGINIADEYINVVKRFGYWKDTAVKIRGEAVKSVLLMFLQMFDVHNQEMENFSYYINDIESVKTDGVVCPFADGPKYYCKEYVGENVYLNLINQAQKYLWITTPYLIIDSKLTTALCSAARRGVDVRIVTPHIPDKKIILSMTRSNYKILQEAGVKVFEYSKGFIHAKQILCDDDLAVVGTINLDYRSLLHHYECGVLMFKTKSIKDIKADFENILIESKDMKNFKQKAITRLFCAICKLFTPML